MNHLKKIYNIHQEYKSFLDELSNKTVRHLQLCGLFGSSKSLFAYSILEKSNGLHLFLFTEKDAAAYFFNDLKNMWIYDNLVFFPSSYKRSIQYMQPDNGNNILRTNALNKIEEYKSSPGKEPFIIISYPEALIEKVISHKKLKEETLHLSKGEKISIEFIQEILYEYNFEFVDFVYEPGQFSIRGGIVDIFSFASDNPYRIDFFGDEIESIRSFDIDSQLSKTTFQKIVIIPDLSHINQNDNNVSLFDFISEINAVWINDISYIGNRISDLFKATSLKDEDQKSMKENILIDNTHFLDQIKSVKTIEFTKNSYFSDTKSFRFNTLLQPAFNKKFELLSENLIEHIYKGYQIYILSDSEKQIERLSHIFEDTDKNIRFIPVNKTLHQGFIDKDLKICCYTDHQIFERYHKYRISSYFSNKATVSIKELKYLSLGDYIVHIDHGIGIFGGLVKINVNGRQQEAVRLVYKDNDSLYVSIHSLHRISKYKGKDDSPPKIYKLGSSAWQNLKQNTKKKIKDIAKDLIALYAKRKTQQGFSFSQDTYLQDELEASFLFEDTPDQLKTTKTVKADMESNIPMDRLVCGDVGFGKTEIAIRASFKAVTDNKQVAILVPTTILALQHYNTFRERLNDFPCRIEYISRLKKPKEQKNILMDLQSGKVDIIIGTHRLLGKDVHFKDLGLLILDEEQKFGVTAKEKLKNIKTNIDTLTLSATPIPRTLQFSLMGARDLSIINTPPPNRFPIITELHMFNEDIIKEGIEYELSRGGQVFFIHNRIQYLPELEVKINKLCPYAKTIIAHGQLEGNKLEQIMLDFISGDYDVLISTTIIESGLDISNVNTIFINDAQNYGLSDLHQLRGRVGRTNKRAFCYLLTPPLTMLTPEAKKRLRAIEEFSDLGSGLNIALQDLDIRGAGNLLGSEQSGFIADIGFETYNRILNEAILELKENEFKNLFTTEKKQEITEIKKKFTQDCQIDTDLEILIPENYISNVSERIRLYRELETAEREDDLNEFENHLTDRFGPLPFQVADLLETVRLRWLAVELGIEKLVLKSGIMILYFISDQESEFYKSNKFINIMNCVQKKPGLFQMKESKNKLNLTIKNIPNIQIAFNILKSINTE